MQKYDALVKSIARLGAGPGRLLRPSSKLCEGRVGAVPWRNQPGPGLPYPFTSILSTMKAPEQSVTIPPFCRS